VLYSGVVHSHQLCSVENASFIYLRIFFFCLRYMLHLVVTVIVSCFLFLGWQNTWQDLESSAVMVRVLRGKCGHLGRDVLRSVSQMSNSCECCGYVVSGGT
jgi:hypothetical protein